VSPAGPQRVLVDRGRDADGDRRVGVAEAGAADAVEDRVLHVTQAGALDRHEAVVRPGQLGDEAQAIVVGLAKFRDGSAIGAADEHVRVHGRNDPLGYRRA
jgi:hypothetical protein